MRKKKFLQFRLFILLLIFSASTIYGQTISVRGTVVNKTGDPVSAASIKVKGSKKGVVANFDGTFELSNIESNSKLVVSAVGFNPTEVNVGSQDFLKIVLDSVNFDLSDVIVTGYGSKKSASNVVGTIATVKGTVTQNKPSANMLDALQGQVAGLQIYTSTGEPDGSSSFSLHGIGSLGAGSTPLILLDGTPIDQGTLLSLNPVDVEDWSVLKDASATSIYGSRAANGVIIITTKQGKAGISTITLSGQYASSQVLGSKFFDRFMNTDELLSYWSETGLLTDAQIAAKLNYPNASKNINTRWNKIYYKDDAPIRSTNLSVSGGGDKTQYFVSGGYIGDEGLAYRSAYDKYTLRSNVSSKVTAWMKFGLNLFFGYDKRQENPYGSNNTNRGLAMLAPPFYSPYDSTGKEYDYIPGWNHYSVNYLAKELPSVSNNTQFNPTAFIEIDPISGLSLKTQAGMDAYDYQISSQTLASYEGSPGNGNASEGFQRGVQRTWTNTAEYQFGINGKHNFDFLGGQEWIDYSYKGISGSSSGQTDDRLMLLSNGPSNITVGESKTEYAYLSFFGKIGYNYSNKYFLDLSIRDDKSSRFGVDKKNATFWSFGGMWKAKKEKFLADINWLSDLTVRLNYGTQGNSDIGNYLNLALVGTNTYQGSTGWDITAPGNPDLTWEKQALTTLGLNFSLFDRARFDISAFNRTTTNMLVSVPYPYTSGFSNITSNVGKLNIKGLDVTVDFDIVKTKDLVITPRFNFEYNREKVVSLFQGLDYWTINGTGILWHIGDPQEYMQPIWAGVNPQTGEPQWYLPGSDPSKMQKDPSKVTSDFDGDALSQNTHTRLNPPFYGGFGLDATYKGFYVDASFSFVNGKYLINNDAYFYENANVFAGYNQWKDVENYWKKPGDKSEFPSLDYQFTEFDTRLIENASFLRLKSLSIGYRIPESVLRKTHVFKGVNIYLVGRNILTVTKYTGADPEVDSNLQLGNYPNTKQYGVGMDIQF